MTEIYTALIEAVREKRPFVLATVIAVRGSTPQKPGAKMLIFPDGTFVGTIGGGCAEGDVWYQARHLLEKESSPVIRKYTLNDDLAAESGMVCGGTMSFLLEPFPRPEVLTPMLPHLEKAVQEKEALVLATVVQSRQPDLKPGDKWVIPESGKWQGPSLPPPIRDSLEKAARSLLSAGGCQLVEVPDQGEFFLDSLVPHPRLILIGAGHINQALAQLATHLDFRITVVDDRPEFANQQRFPGADQIVVAPIPEAFRRITIKPNHFIVIATRGHKLDDVAVQEAFRTSASYIGLVGSRRKVQLIQRKLRDMGLDSQHMERLHAPVGLDIGAITPQEIALSILAEIVQCRRGGTGMPLVRLQGKKHSLTSRITSHTD